MRFLDGLFETKVRADPNKVVSRATSASQGGGFGWGLGPVGNWDIDKAVNQGLERVVWIYRCCDVIATNQARLPLKSRKFEQTMDRENGEWIDNPELFRLLNIRANAYETAFQFRYRLSMNLLLARRGAFIEVIRNAFGIPIALHILPSSRTRPVPHPTEFVSHYEVDEVGGGFVKVAKKDVIWLRLKPHPTDPYAQMTPLMAAGISAETDWLAHVFNRNFLANDGRPGMLVSISGQLNPEDAREIKARFSGGPLRAGEATVIESDGVDVADLSASPRDVQWSDLLDRTKDEFLIAFGVPESVMGNASGRTFDNADAERENFWMDTEVPHCDAIAQGLDPLTGDEKDNTVMAFDYASIDVLQRALRVKREEWRAEVSAGVRTINGYFKAIGEEEWDTIGAKILWHPSGIAIAPTDKEQAEIASLRKVGEPQEPDPLAEAVGQIESTVNGLGNNLAARAQSLASNVTSITDAPSQRGLTRRSERRIASGREPGPTRVAASDFKALPSAEVVDAEIVDEKEHPYADLRTRMEGFIEGVVTGWDERQEKVVTDRLNHVKSRKGTRHWDGAHTGEQKALDPGYAVEVDRWVDELRGALMKTVRNAMLREARNSARDLKATGVLDRMEADKYGRTHEGDALHRVFGTEREMNAHLEGLYLQVDEIVRKAAANQSARLQGVIQKMDAEGRTMRQIEREVRRQVGQRSQWRKTLAANVVTTAVEGARNEVYSQAAEYITKEWHAEQDERTRPSHVAADGQTRQGNDPFIVGGVPLDFPADPKGPPHEVVNCRCWVDFRPSEDFYN